MGRRFYASFFEASNLDEAIERYREKNHPKNEVRFYPEEFTSKSEAMHFLETRIKEEDNFASMVKLKNRNIYLYEFVLAS